MTVTEYIALSSVLIAAFSAGLMLYVALRVQKVAVSLNGRLTEFLELRDKVARAEQRKEDNPNEQVR